MRMARVLGLAVFLSLALAGCGDDEGGGTSGGARDTGDEISTTSDAPVIEITDPGSSPRRLLSLDVDEGQTETTTMTLQQSQRVTGLPSSEVPPITLSYTTEVMAVDPDRIDTELVYGKASVDARGADPDLVDQIESALEPLDGLTGHSAVSPRGENIETTFDVPSDLPPMMSSMIQQFSDQATAIMVPFPDEPVGAGAKWTAATDLELNGIEVHQTTKYSLEALQGTSYRISVDVQQTFEPGSVEGLEVSGGTSTSHGELRGDTTLLTPRASTAEGTSVLQGEVSGRRVDFRSRLKMSMHSGPS